MADDIDFANEHRDRELSRLLNEFRQNNAKNAKGAKHCVECNDPIPDARQKLGFSLCVPCAEEAERRKSLFADY